jgi:hypothetical protein
MAGGSPTYSTQEEDVIERVRPDLERGLKRSALGRRRLTPAQVLSSLILTRVKSRDYRELRESQNQKPRISCRAAGVAALVRAANPGLTPSQVRTILQQTAQDIGKPGYDPLFNFGLVDATAAVATAAGR